jgi:hypothetical protein
MLIVGAAFALAACATVPPPSFDALQAADFAVANADRDHAADLAPLEMRTASEKLAAAHQISKVPDDRSVVHERRLADEERADAERATARAALSARTRSIGSCEKATTSGGGNYNAVLEPETWIISVM